MEELIGFIAQVLAPLSIGIVFTAIVAGIFMGVLYRYRFSPNEDVVLDVLVAGWSFLAFIFTFRAVSAAVGGTVAPMFFGWIGIGILWAIYCGSILVGERIAGRIRRKLLKHK